RRQLQAPALVLAGDGVVESSGRGDVLAAVVDVLGRDAPVLDAALQVGDAEGDAGRFEGVTFAAERVDGGAQVGRGAAGCLHLRGAAAGGRETEASASGVERADERPRPVAVLELPALLLVAGEGEREAALEPPRARPPPADSEPAEIKGGVEHRHRRSA